jgi:ABC-2 type transport system ATP-binding protein
VRVDGPRQWLAFPTSASAAPLVSAVASRYPLADLSIREPAIEDVIAKLYTSGVGRPSACHRTDAAPDPVSDPMPDPTAPR